RPPADLFNNDHAGENRRVFQPDGIVCQFGNLLADKDVCSTRPHPINKKLCRTGWIDHAVAWDAKTTDEVTSKVRLCFLERLCIKHFNRNAAFVVVMFFASYFL